MREKMATVPGTKGDTPSEDSGSERGQSLRGQSPKKAALPVMVAARPGVARGRPASSGSVRTRFCQGSGMHQSPLPAGRLHAESQMHGL